MSTIRREIHDAGVLNGDSPFHEEGTGGLEATKFLPMRGGSMSWNDLEMWTSASSGYVVGVWEASEEQETKESPQTGDVVTRTVINSKTGVREEPR